MNQTCEYCGTTIVDSPYWLRLSPSPGVRVFCDDCIAYTGTGSREPAPHLTRWQRIKLWWHRRRLPAWESDLFDRLTQDVTTMFENLVSMGKDKLNEVGTVLGEMQQLLRIEIEPDEDK